MSFALVEKVTVKIHNGRRDWVLGAIKRHGSKRLDAAPLGEDEIIIQVNDGRKLFFAEETNPNAMGMVPIFRVGERGSTFGIMGYYPKTHEQISASVSKVTNTE